MPKQSLSNLAPLMLLTNSLSHTSRQGSGGSNPRCSRWSGAPRIMYSHFIRPCIMTVPVEDSWVPSLPSVVVVYSNFSYTTVCSFSAPRSLFIFCSITAVGAHPPSAPALEVILKYQYLEANQMNIRKHRKIFTYFDLSFLRFNATSPVSPIFFIFWMSNWKYNIRIGFIQCIVFHPTPSTCI